jgi:hypothetical protein
VCDEWRNLGIILLSPHKNVRIHKETKFGNPPGTPGGDFLNKKKIPEGGS